MAIALEVFIVTLNICLVIYHSRIRIKNRKEILKWQSDQLKYQKHLRNSFDYLNLMQNAMSEGDVVTFLECSRLVAEELTKCNEVISK